MSITSMSYMYILYSLLLGLIYHGLFCSVHRNDVHNRPNNTCSNYIITVEIQYIHTVLCGSFICITHSSKKDIGY